MKRRPIERIVILVAGLLVVPLSVEAPLSTTVPTIGFLMLSSLAPDSLFFELFRQTLREVGYVEGQNVHLEYRWADRRAERLPDLAAELVRRKVDVIVVGETPAIYAAQQATRTIPIVMVSVADPETLGLVERLSRPGGNLTGVTGMVPELSGKLLELLTRGSPWAPAWRSYGLRTLAVPPIGWTRSRVRHTRWRWSCYRWRCTVPMSSSVPSKLPARGVLGRCSSYQPSSSR